MSLIVVTLLPAALTVYLSFNAGGFFAGTQGLVAAILALALVLRVTTTPRPFEGFGAGIALALAALSLYAVWALASVAWSDAPARAILEFDRALIYALTLALFGSLAGSRARVGWALRGLAVGIAIVCVIALITRLLPEVWPISPNTGNDRLSYPLTYWNALGLLAAVGLILCLHLTSSTREKIAIRIAGAAISPLLGATLLLTFSRGAMAVAILGLVVYVLVGRAHGLPSGLLAAGPTTAAAMVAAYNAELLASPDPTTAGAVAQGQDVAIVVALCVVAAAVLRGLLLPLDPRLARLRLADDTRRRVRIAAAALAIAAVAAAAVTLPGELERQYDRFLVTDFGGQGELRDRLTNPGSNGRLEYWDVALEGFQGSPLNGRGAGTYQVLWAQQRPFDSTAVDGHSLYMETLAELGIVGLLLVGTAILAILVGFARRARGTPRSLYAALFAAGLAWALHAGIDWDWELPAVTVWFFALGGLALAAPSAARKARTPRPFPRLIIAMGCLLLAVTPALVLVSQTRLNNSVAAFERDDCPTAIDSALGSLSAVGARPEPFEILGYCDSRLGLDSLAIESMRSAVERDPDNWEFHYGLAVVTGAAGRDPRPAAGAALELNPREPLIQDLVDRFQTDDPRAWEREAEATTLPFR